MWFMKYFILLFCSCGSSVSNSSKSDFFNVDGGNLTKITWAHAVNDKKFLEDTLASSVMFIEADIVLGHLYDNDSGPAIPIMAHPPAILSNLSFQEFLSTIAKFNEHNPTTQKGVKLDFKSIEAFSACQNYLLPYNHAKITYPIWLNADILPGPVNSETKPVDANKFLYISKSYPRCVLSIGWTTNFGGDITSGEYTKDHIDNMLKTIKENEITQEVTFPVRAAIAANSYEQIARLLVETSHLNSTLTVWSSSAADVVDIDKLRKFILDIGLDKTYLDVLAEIEKELNLPSK